VPADRKDVARVQVRAALGQLGPARILYVRVNSLDSGMTGEDLAAIAVPGLEGIRVPKVETVEAVREVDGLLGEAERSHGLPVGSIRLSLGLESARAVMRTYDLCRASARVSSVAPGLGRGGDLQSDIGYRWTEEGIETLHIRSKVVLDARAAGVPIPLDGGYGTYDSWDPARDEERFLASANLGRQLGYRAKICFHPGQVDHVNDIFDYEGDDL
jgi:citrate lyase subunit beta / citryl-CoA lyase